MTRRHRQVPRQDRTVRRREVQQDLHGALQPQPGVGAVPALRRRPAARVQNHQRRGRGARPRLGQGAHGAEHTAGEGEWIQDLQSRRHWRLFTTDLLQPRTARAASSSIFRVCGRLRDTCLRCTASPRRAGCHDTRAKYIVDMEGATR